MNAGRAAFVLTALLALGCSSSERPLGSTTATLFGPEARLDSWTTSLVEGIHVHAFEPEWPCAAAGMNEILGAVSGAMPEPRLDMKQLSAGLDAVMESMLATANGPAHGGPDRAVLALRRADESLLVDFPRLRPEEKERLFKAGDVKAVYIRPARTTAARLERGWVRVVRAEGGRAEVDLFLVLRMLAPDAPVGTLQVITRVEWPPSGTR